MMVRPNLVSLLLASALALATACGEDDPPVNIPNKPVIDSFTVDKSSVLPGEQVTLSWTIRYAKAIRLIGTSGEPLDVGGLSHTSDSFIHTPAATTTYKLIAIGAYNEVSGEVTVEFKQEAPTVKFYAEKPRLYHGESTVLVWETTNATHVTLTAGSLQVDIGNQLSGTLPISPNRTTEYELVAIGVGQAREKAPVEVAPIIEYFEAVLPEGSQRVDAGSKVMVKWKTAGAEELVISGDGLHDTIAAINRNEGQMRITVPPDGKVELVASRGPTSEIAELGLVLRDVPVIISAKATPPVVTSGVETTIRFEWVIEDADKLELTGDPGGLISTFGKKNSADFVDISKLTEATRLTLKATNNMGVATAEVLVGQVAPPSIVSFRALPSRVAANEPVQIAWEATSVAKVELFRGDEALDIDGSKATGTFSDRLTEDADYRLRVVNQAGAEVSETIHVAIGAPVIETFETVQKRILPGATFDLAWKVHGGVGLEVKGAGGAVIAACTTNSLVQIASGGCRLTAPATQGNQTYELTVTNGAGAKVTQSLVVQVSNGAFIKSFTITEAEVSPGGNVNLSWDVENDQAGQTPTLELRDDRGTEVSLTGKNPNRGSVVATAGVPGTRTYTLTARTTGTADVSATASIEVIPLATVSLVASPQPFNPGTTDKLTLSWETTGAVSLELFVLGVDGTTWSPLPFKTSTPARVARGSTETTPPYRSTVVFRALATNKLGATNTSELPVQILMPSIASFTASPRGADGTVTLSWNTSGAKVGLRSRTGSTDFQFVEVSTAAPYVDVEAIPSRSAVTLTTCGHTTPATDDGCADFGLGFDFPFEGGSYSQARAFVNGFLGLDTTEAFPVGSQQNSGFTINGTKKFMNIAAYWANLKLSAASTSGLFYFTQPDPTWGEHTIIQWKELLAAPSGVNPMNFEVVLFKSGNYDLRYGNMTSQNTGARGWQSTTGSPFHNIPTTKLTEGGGVSNFRSFRRVVNAPATGSLQVNVPATTTFTLTASSPAGSPTQAVTVTVP